MEKKLQKEKEESMSFPWSRIHGTKREKKKKKKEKEIESEGGSQEIKGCQEVEKECTWRKVCRQRGSADREKEVPRNGTKRSLEWNSS